MTLKKIIFFSSPALILSLLVSCTAVGPYDFPDHIHYMYIHYQAVNHTQTNLQLKANMTQIQSPPHINTHTGHDVPLTPGKTYKNRLTSIAYGYSNDKKEFIISFHFTVINKAAKQTNTYVGWKQSHYQLNEPNIEYGLGFTHYISLEANKMYTKLYKNSAEAYTNTPYQNGKVSSNRLSLRLDIYPQSNVWSLQSNTGQ